MKICLSDPMKIGTLFSDDPNSQRASSAGPARWSTPPAPTGPPDGGGLALLPKVTQDKVNAIADDIKTMCRMATDVPLASTAEAHVLSDALVSGKQAYKELEASRRALVDPLNAQVKKINKVFEPLTSSLEAFEGRAKRLLGAFQQQDEARTKREQEAARLAQEDAARREADAMAKAEASSGAERQAALAEADAASRLQTEALVTAPTAAVRAYKGDMGSTGVRKRWTFEVVKPDFVPRQYMSVDQIKIRAAVAAGVREIAGVNIYETSDVAVRIG